MISAATETGSKFNIEQAEALLTSIDILRMQEPAAAAANKPGNGFHVSSIGGSLFAIRPDLPDWLLTRPIAHRGLHDNTSGLPENSLASIHACAAAGCPVEIDVRVLADGQLAVFHDSTTDRMTGRHRRIAQSHTAEIKALTLLATEERIPLLGEALGVVAGAVPLLIEVKCETLRIGRVTEAVAREMAGYHGAYAIQSFNPRVLRLMRRLAPGVPLALLSGWHLGTSLAWIARPNLLCQEIHRLGDASVQRARRSGVPVLAWVVRDAGTLRDAARLADNYIFEESPNFAKPTGAVSFST